MKGKWKLIRKLKSRVFWGTKMSSTEETMHLIIEDWLKRNPDYIPVYMENAEKVIWHCRGSMQARKEELVLKQDT